MNCSIFRNICRFIQPISSSLNSLIYHIYLPNQILCLSPPKNDCDISSTLIVSLEFHYAIVVVM